MPTAPPATDTKKPATPPPARDDKKAGAKAGGDQAAGARAAETQGKGKDQGAAANAQQAGKEKTAAAGATGAKTTPGGDKSAASQQRFDRMAVRAKLAVSEPGDAVEKEADAVAAKVMRMEEPAAGGKDKTKPASPAEGKTPAGRTGKDKEIRRKAVPDNPQAKPGGAAESEAKTDVTADSASARGVAAQEARVAAREGRPKAAADEQDESKDKPAPSEDTIHRKAAPGEEGPAAAKDRVSAEGGATSNQSAADQPGTTKELIERLGGGEPLDAGIRAWFERRMNTDFGHVRIHADEAADRAARQIDARAFTYGSHIAFAAGHYQPGSEQGRALLAHELAHVLQQNAGSVSRMIMRAPAGGSATSSGDFEVTNAELEVPPIKARHIGGYKALAEPGNLKRKGAYDASTRGTKQVALWTGGVKVDVNKIPPAQRPSSAAGIDLNLNVKGGASAKVIKAGSLEDLNRLLQIPTWDAAGNDIQFQVDHMVEYQLGGADALDNMELLNQAHNGSVGSSFSHAIKRTVREEIQKDPAKPALTSYTGPKNASGEPTAEGVMAAMTVIFRKVRGRARESKRREGGSVFWTKEQIEALDHVLPLLGTGGNLEGTATSFALLSPTGNLLIAQLRHGNGQNTIAIGHNQAGGMAGFRMKRLKLNDKYNDAAAGANIGTLEGSLNFGPSVSIPPGDVSVGVSQARSPGKHSGKVGAGAGSGLPNEVDFKPMSPLTLSDISFGKSVFGRAMLKPTHPALEGISIPAQIEDGKLGIFYTLDATALAGKLKIPGVRIDSAGITFGYDGSAFSVSGGTEFTIQKFGTGYLTAYADTRNDFSLEGGLRADKRLFDVADVKLWYRKKGGFGGSGRLGITTPGKIKGIQSASLTVTYADSVFSAEGTVTPEIPGLKAASLAVTYADDQLKITGKLAIDEKVPGVEQADITVTVQQINDGWKVAASGDVTPKLPGLSGANLKFSYDDGFVLVEGKFSVKKGPLDGEVMAGVTNAAVDDKGKRSDKGEGDNFKVFGTAKIKATFIKDKLDGTLMLRLLPDGNVKVGGSLEVQPFEVFGKYPEDGGKFLDETFSTPRIPLPGLGFSVGSIAVGVNFGASLTLSAHACVGPGKLSGIKVTIEEFDPVNDDLTKLKVAGSGQFLVYADAGFGVSAEIELIFSAAVAELVGSVGAEAQAGIPADKPVVSATANFTWSESDGFDILGTLNLAIAPELKFRLFGEVSARLNVVVDTITVWSKDWTLAEANYKLPIGINATGTLGYNSKTNTFRPSSISEAIKVDTSPKLDADAMQGVLMGDSAPPQVHNTDAGSQEQPGAVHPKRANDAAAGGMGDEPPPPVDEDLVDRIGKGEPLNLSTRGYFEQRMQVDLSRVLIHIGPSAAREAEKLQAEAFTVGEHIAFAEGRYQPDTPEGQELIAHELAHIAQKQRGGARIVLRWPAVTRTDAHTSETPATIRAMTLSGFSTLTQTQLDWATSPALQADAAALGQFRDIQTFAEGPHIAEACGGLNVGDIIGKGIPGVYPKLRKYTEGVTSNATAWLRRTATIDEAERWGDELTTLEAAWPAANLSLVMRRPDPVANPSPFEKLENPAAPELANFIGYLTVCNPVLSAENGREVDSFLALRTEGAMPTAYAPTVTHVRNYHHFTKPTLDGLVANEAFPQWKQGWGMFQRPLTVVLYPSVDHNGAFHRNAGLQAMVTNGDILTIVVEGGATVADYQSQLAPVAARYGINGEIHQAMVGGHGNSNILVLAGAQSGAGIAEDSLGTAGASGTSTTNLMTELTRLMSADPARRRIVLDACLTNSHHVASALRAAPADAAADVNAAIAANPSLRDFVAGMAGAGANVFGANASFAPAQTTFMTPGSTDIGLSVPGDPDLIATKLTYVEFGTEPEGCMRALLECWAADQVAGSTHTRDAVLRRIGAGASTHVPVPKRSTWREHIIQPLYDLAAHHYWGNGESLRQMGSLAGAVFELYWVGHTSAATLNTRLGVLAGNAAHVDQLLTSVSGDPHYAATPRVALVIEQAWMQHTPARRAQFLTALGRYATCLEASADLAMALVMPQVPALLTLPPPAPPPADQLKLALLAAHHAPVGTPPPAPLPAHIQFLTSLLGAGPTFPAALGIDAALGGLAGEDDILAAIGRPIGAGAPAPGVPPAANINLGRTDAPDRNDFRITPLRRNGVVATVRDHLNVRRRPTTGVSPLGSLPPGTPVFVLGEYGDWYAIEQPNATGFVAKRYVTLVP